MKAIFSALHKELSAGKSGVLCSIIASEGSTPRGSGAKMLVMADGSTAGTIGGGAVEYRWTAAGRFGWSLPSMVTAAGAGGCGTKMAP